MWCSGVSIPFFTRNVAFDELRGKTRPSNRISLSTHLIKCKSMIITFLLNFHNKATSKKHAAESFLITSNSFFITSYLFFLS